MTLLNSIRFLCILSVVLFHAKSEYFRFGYLGVDGFFVLSGFLIGTNIVWKNRYKTPIEFLIRRLLRLYPLLLFTTISTSCIFILLYPNSMTKVILASGVSSLAFLSNLYYGSIGGYFDQTLKYLPLLHTWSLSAEFQFYLVTFALLVITNKFDLNQRRIIFVNLFFVILIVSYYWYSQTVFERPTLNFFAPHTRIWQFALGIVVSYFIKEKNKDQLSANEYKMIIFFGLILIFLIGYMYLYEDYNYLRETSTIVFVLLIIGLILFEKKLLFLRVFDSYGRYAYSIYLAHYPILVILSMYNFPDYSYYVFVLLLFVLFSSIGNQIENFARVPRYSLSYISVIILCLFILGYLKLYQNSNSVDQKINYYSDYVQDAFNAASTGGDVLIVGDSYAQDMFNVFELLKTTEVHANMELSAKYVHFDCHIELAASISPNSFCAKYGLEQHMIENSNVLVFAKNWAPGFDEKLEKILINFPNKKVLIIGTKHFGKINLHFLEDNIERMRDLSHIKLEKVKIINNQIFEFSSLYENVTFYNPMDAFCSGNYCKVTDGGDLYSYDGGHLTPSGVKVIAEHILQHYGSLYKFIHRN